MFHDKSIFRVTISVSVLLVFVFALTGYLTSVYRREKLALGERHYLDGQQLQKKGDLEGSVEEYRKALLFSPDRSEYRLSFASALVEAGHLDEAESHIDQMLQEDPTNGVLNLMRGRIATRRHETEKAIDFYGRAVYEYWPSSRADDRRSARWELIRLLDQSGRREQSIGELMTMYANAPADLNLRMRIGFDLLRRSATSEALQVFREVARVAPKLAQVHFGLGLALQTTGDLVSARHEFERASKLDPKDKAITQELAKTNLIIELNPEMPSLTSAERYRRSQNLLKRVLGDVGRCTSATENEQVTSAKELLNGKVSKDPDAALRLQSAAIGVWNARSALCGSKAMDDEIVKTVLERITNE